MTQSFFASKLYFLRINRTIAPQGTQRKVENEMKYTRELGLPCHIFSRVHATMLAAVLVNMILIKKNRLHLATSLPRGVFTLRGFYLAGI